MELEAKMGTENVGTPTIIEAQDDTPEKLSATEQKELCNESIFSNIAPESLASPPDVSTPSTSSTKSRLPLKRKRKDNEENGSRDQGNKNPKSGPAKGQRGGSFLGRRLACPFHLFDPEKYCKNTITEAKYNTCSGPGFLEWHYLKLTYRQQLGKSQSAVHIKIRCPHCFTSFKTAAAVIQHQESQSSECIQNQTHLTEDDIDKDTWNKIDQEASTQGYIELPQIIRQSIDDLVSRNLGAYTPRKSIEAREGDLRKWYMVWGILFPGTRLPQHPFYDDKTYKSMTKVNRLIKSFKETVELDIQAEKIKEIDDETLEKLLECLRAVIRASSRAYQAPSDIQLSNLSSSLHSLPTGNLRTVEHTITRNFASPCGTPSDFIYPTMPRQFIGGSTAQQENGYNELVEGPASDPAVEDSPMLLRSTLTSIDIPGQLTADNGTNSSDVKYEIYNSHLDPNYSFDADPDCETFMQFNGSFSYAADDPSYAVSQTPDASECIFHDDPSFLSRQNRSLESHTLLNSG
ncbi:hypothetical protein F5884DRAFT_744962 [Xylogone sp. PMI_703]|nr:hypothetical protein F5884DRAFT_744962 [Xylogone sp. PMI_703]